MPPKIEILVFFKKKNPMCKGSTRVSYMFIIWIFNFLYVFFIVKKWPLYVNFSISTCGK
jgi:hypothetical protein